MNKGNSQGNFENEQKYNENKNKKKTGDGLISASTRSPTHELFQATLKVTRSQ